MSTLTPEQKIEHQKLMEKYERIEKSSLKNKYKSKNIDDLFLDNISKDDIMLEALIVTS